MGAVPDVCAAAHLDRPDLLARMIADDPACVHQRGGDGQTPLHFATSRRVIDLLLADEPTARVVLGDHPGVIASMQPDDHRVISDAAWNGDAAAVALMLDLGFDPRTPGHDSGSALHCAAWQGSAETVRALLMHDRGRALLESRDARYDFTPLGWCCHGSRHGNTSRDHAGVASLLLEAGAQLGTDTREASPSVERVLARWRRAR